MERKAVKQLNMVSRLPKFASRSSGTPMTALPQGSTIPVSSSESTGGPLVRPNNLTHLQSLNWRKGEEDIGNKVQHCDSLDEETSATTVTPVMVTKKPSPTAAVKSKSAVPTLQTSCPRSIPQPSKTFPRMTTPKRLSTGNSLYNNMASQNGVSVGNGRCGSSVPGVSHISQKRTLQSKLSLSNESIKSDTKDSIVRSQSFTHSKKPTFPTNPPITRSFSFNKAAELAKELPRPLAQSPVAKSSLIQPNTVLSEEKVNKYEIPRPAVTTSSHLLQTNTIKKSLLPSFSGNKPSVLRYGLSRPTLNKHPRPVLLGIVQKDTELSKNVQDTTQIAETSSEPCSNIKSIETTPHETCFEAKEAEGSLGPSLEDMSQSSSSSVEHNTSDTSEEYMDDFDNLGNGGETLLLPVLGEGLDHFGLCKDDNNLISKCNEESSMASLHNFLSETVDWAGMGLAACKDGFEHETLSPVGDFPHGSSLDLSPSDSSGGTYMWDEEGMEALGGSGHHCGSFDSDINSMAILDNLENVESCNLEEDDLMLDLDLSEDASLHSDTDGTSPFEYFEKDGWPSQRWKRPQLWGRSDQFCHENRSGILQSFDGRKKQELQRSRADHVTLDELTLKLMTQDCSSVKEQLLQLKTLLQMETEGSVEDTLKHNSPSSTDQALLDQKVVLLLKEVEELRDELRSKDRMIAELSQQLSSPVENMQCRCLQGSEANKESTEHQDKDTQTLWKAHNLQILQTPRFLHKLHNHERLSSPTTSEAPCDSLDAEPGHHPLMPQSCSPDLKSPITVESTPNCAIPTVTISADSSAAFSSRTFQSSDPAELGLMSNQVKINEPAIPPASASFCCKLERGIQKLPLRRSNFSALQPPTSIKRASTLIKPQEVQRVSVFTGALGRLGATGLSRTRHQPLSAAGLLCINPARQNIMHSTTAPIFNQQNQGCRQSLLLRNIESSLPRTSSPLQPKHSRLPKPKTISSLPNPAAQQGQTTTSPTLLSRMLPQF